MGGISSDRRGDSFTVSDTGSAELSEKWAHRAALAEAAVNDRHASRVWGLPRTNIAVVSWPPNSKDRLLFHWHYWWQAHYLDCLVDAVLRQPTKARRQIVGNTMRGIRLRNHAPLRDNRYYDDKAWLALAMGRAEAVDKLPHAKQLGELRANIFAGIDPIAGVLPWRTGETFFNVPANGPAAILMARNGRVEQAMSIVDWAFDNLLDDDGLIMDGIRMRMTGPETVTNIHPYNQGTIMGACLEIVLALRERIGLDVYEPLENAAPKHAETAHDIARYSARIRDLVQAVAIQGATPGGVIKWETGDGDGGLFKGILTRYLADVAVRLPADSAANRAARKLSKRLVTNSSEALWSHRLEVDGLPVFGTDWTQNARLPHNYGSGPNSLGSAVGVIRIAERDLSVQLSAWITLEAAARAHREG